MRVGNRHPQNQKQSRNTHIHIHEHENGSFSLPNTRLASSVHFIDMSLKVLVSSAPGNNPANYRAITN